MFMYFLLRFIFELTLNARKFDFWFKKNKVKAALHTFLWDSM